MKKSIEVSSPYADFIEKQADTTGLSESEIAQMGIGLFMAFLSQAPPRTPRPATTATSEVKPRPNWTNEPYAMIALSFIERMRVITTNPIMVGEVDIYKSLLAQYGPRPSQD